MKKIGSILRWAFAALILLTALGSFSYSRYGPRGIITGIILLAAAFLMSPLSTILGVYNGKGFLSVITSVVAFFVALGVLPSTDNIGDIEKEDSTRNIVADNSVDDTTSVSATTTTASAEFVDTTTTTIVEIDLSTITVTNQTGSIDRSFQEERTSSTTTSKTTTTAPATTTTTTTTKAETTTTTIITTTAKKTTTTVATTQASAALQVTSFPAVVYRNEDVTLCASGQPNTEYTLNVYYSSGASTAAGLGKKSSDSSGNISWSWQIGGRTNPGNYRMTISGGGETITYYFTVGES